MTDIINNHPMCEDASCPARENCFRHRASGRLPRASAQPYFSEPTRARDEESCDYHWPIRVAGRRVQVRRAGVDKNYTYRNDPSQISMFLRIGEVAKMMNLAPGTVRRLQKRAGFPAPVVLSGKTRYWNRSEVEQYLLSGQDNSREGVGRHAWRKPPGTQEAFPWEHEEEVE